MTEPLEEEFATVRQGFVDAWGIEEYVSERTASSRFYPALDTIQAEHRRLAALNELRRAPFEMERKFAESEVRREEAENVAIWNASRIVQLVAALRAVQGVLMGRPDTLAAQGVIDHALNMAMELPE